jgi:hypothetical protein
MEKVVLAEITCRNNSSVDAGANKGEFRGRVFGELLWQGKAG